MNKKQIILICAIALLLIASVVLAILAGKSRKQEPEAGFDPDAVQTVLPDTDGGTNPIQPVTRISKSETEAKDAEPSEHGEVWIDVSDPNGDGHDPDPKVIGDVSVIRGIKEGGEP